MKKAVFFILIGMLFWLFFCILIFVRWKHYKREQDMKTRYISTFGHTPDMFTLQKWSKIQKDRNRIFDRFSEQVFRSEEKAQTESIVFVGLIRNNGSRAIQFWVPLLKELGGFFKDYRVIFLENDSTDDTREQLLSLTQYDDRFLLFCPGNKDKWNSSTCSLQMVSAENKTEKQNKLAHRLKILSFLRESYMEEIRKLKGVDFIMNIDWDLQGDLSIEGFLHALSILRENREVDGVAVNSFHKRLGVWYIYDTFPLFPLHYCKEIQHQQKILDQKTQQKFYKMFNEAIFPIPLPSAFGGLAVYKYSSLEKKDPHYVLDGKCPYQCEHSIFHKRLNMVLDPWFIFLIYKNMS
jgi:hypothetical protein